ISVCSPACSTHRASERAPALCRSLHYHWAGLTDRGRFPRTHSRRPETFAGGIAGGTECAGCEHWNFLAPVRSFLAGSAAVRTHWLALEFASTGCSRYLSRSSLAHLRDHALFALSES